jgi:hypothetical protein
LELGSQLIVKRTEVKIGSSLHSLADGAQTGFEIKKRPFAKGTIAGKNKIDKVFPKK